MQRTTASPTPSAPSRRGGFDGPITLIGAEMHFPPIDRPPLSKTFMHLDGQAPAIKVAPNLDVDLRLGRRAVALDVSNQHVSMDDGDDLGYDGLVIATGATARTLPSLNGRLNVFVLRTLDDAVALRAALAPGVRVALIGAGVLGVFFPGVAAIGAGYALLVSLAWHSREAAVLAIEQRDGVKFYVVPNSALRPIQLVRTPGLRSSRRAHA